MNDAQRFASLEVAFRSHFGSRPELWVRAPGRVDLMGSHTDYNQGFVLTLPIDRDTWIAARRRKDDQVCVVSLNLDARCQFSSRAPSEPPQAGWGRYVQAVFQTLSQAGYATAGCEAVIHGDVPIGSGLSSSASLEAATACLLELLGDYTIPPVEKAQLCQRAENEIVGVNCGILDQYSSILGVAEAAVVLDCRRLMHRYTAFPRELRVVICNTCAPRGLVGSAYGERRASCERVARHFAKSDPSIAALRDVPLERFEMHQAQLDATDARRARFIIEENQRVQHLADALAVGQRAAIARLMTDSFSGARDLFEITIPVMEDMYRCMTCAPGVVGARQAGAGFGGCMVAIVQSGAVPVFCDAVSQSYAATTGIRPEVYPVRPAAGAGPLNRDSG